MLQAKDACYVLVRTSTEGFDLYQRLVDAGVPARPVIEVAPYPIERIVRVAGAIDPARDTYC